MQSVHCTRDTVLEVRGNAYNSLREHLEVHSGQTYLDLYVPHEYFGPFGTFWTPWIFIYLFGTFNLLDTLDLEVPF